MSPEIEELYQEVILDHSRRPRNFGELPDAAVLVHGDNPACGDEIHLAVKFDANGGLEDIKFSGRGCAISQASASLMTESVKGRTRAEAESLFERFHDLIVGKGGESGDESSQLGKLAVFSGVREYPVRVKCATLPWHTLKAALDGDGGKVSTEDEGPKAESGGA